MHDLKMVVWSAVTRRRVLGDASAYGLVTSLRTSAGFVGSCSTHHHRIPRLLFDTTKHTATMAPNFDKTPMKNDLILRTAWGKL